MPRGIERHNTLDLGGNYADVAKALGAWSRRVAEPQAIASTLKQAIEVTQSREPAVVEFVVKEGTRFSRY
jgi:acetolactate synthase I/II/III large subunit